METYEAKARIWNVLWEGHEIRFEFLKETILGDYILPRHRKAIFFDGKRAKTTWLEGSEITVVSTGNDGKDYSIKCGVFKKSCSPLEWPLRKSFWGGLFDRIDRLLTYLELNVWFEVNGKVIYLSHIGGEDEIEWAKIHKELDLLKKKERALAKGKIMVQSSSGWHKRKATQEELEKTKMHLVNNRKELEFKLNSLESKNKRD